MKTYLVGGAVRDRLLGIPVTDRDWMVVGSSPQQMLDAGYRPVGKDFPVFIHPESGEEYALARTERKTGRGHGDFTFHTSPDVTLEDDLLRRDFTINAIVEDDSGELIDPFGGQQDLDSRILRHVSEAFVEDPLRVLRAARFTARFNHLGFTIAEETRQLMAQIVVSGELQALSAERVWQETQKALSEGSPRTYIEILRECGALAVLLPELDRLFGVPQRADYHPEIDTGLHTLMALDKAVELSDSPEVRYAVLVHDLGKGITPEDILPRHIGHEEKGVPLVEAVSKRLRVPKRFIKLAVAVTRFHLQCHKIDTLRPKTILKLLKGLDIFRNPEQLDLFLLACEADARGRANFEDQPYRSALWLKNLFSEINILTTGELIKAGFKGIALGEEIDKQRLKTISQYKAANSKTTHPKASTHHV
jgi:tRNA nucleotidyltransferase (CCA-adding enzyme)